LIGEAELARFLEAFEFFEEPFSALSENEKWDMVWYV